MRIFLSYFFLFINLTISAQLKPWIGYAEGLQYFSITADNITLHTTKNSLPSRLRYLEEKEGFHHCMRLDEETGEDRYKVKFRFLNKNKDSLILFGFGKNPIIFKRKEFYKVKNKIKFNHFEFAYLNSFAGVIRKVEFNFLGYLRLSDFKNQTIFEQQLSQDYIDKFLRIIDPLDIKSLNDLGTWRNSCNDNEYSFSFYDPYNRYSTAGIKIHPLLRSILVFLEEVLQEFDQVVIPKN